jgi:uncharacterized protein YbjQ (UPF0145 family)
MLMVTTESVPGYTIIKSLGLALACMPYAGDKYASGIKDLNGVTNANLPALLEDQWVGLLRRLNACGQEMGAHAIVDIRLESREITSMWRELQAYGTAVLLSPNRTKPVQ